MRGKVLLLFFSCFQEDETDCFSYIQADRNDCFGYLQTDGKDCFSYIQEDDKDCFVPILSGVVLPKIYIGTRNDLVSKIIL